jgi:CRP/FNR family transcriptional regulator, cyclic AMP receptor protein
MRSAVDEGLLTQLRGIYMFSELNDKQLRRVADLGKIVNHGAGHTIVAQGQPALSFHLLLDGEANVLVNDAVRRTLGRGDYFGEVAVIDRKPRSASVVTVTPVQAWALTGTAFNDLLETEGSVAHAVVLGLCSRLRDLEGVPATRG